MKAGRHFIWKDSIYQVINELKEEGGKLEHGDLIGLNSGDLLFYNGKSFVYLSNIQNIREELSWKDL